MRYRVITTTLLTLMLISGCSTGIGNRTEVVRVGADDLLKLRAGPGLGFRVVLGLPDGTQLIQRDCVTESSQLWCRVSLVEAPSVTVRPEALEDAMTSQKIDDVLEYMSCGHEMRLQEHFRLTQGK